MTDLEIRYNKQNYLEIEHVLLLFIYNLWKRVFFKNMFICIQGNFFTFWWYLVLFRHLTIFNFQFVKEFLP